MRADLLAQPASHHGAGPHPVRGRRACRALLSPPGTASGAAVSPAPYPPPPPAWPRPLAPAAPGGPSGSAHVDIQTAMTLQEAGACGPGRVGVGVGADETGCMPVILLQGRQEGQMGFLVSALAPSGQKGLGDCETCDRQGPLPTGLLSHAHSINLLPEEILPRQPHLLGSGHWQAVGVTQGNENTVCSQADKVPVTSRPF